MEQTAPRPSTPSEYANKCKKNVLKSPPRPPLDRGARYCGQRVSQSDLGRLAHAWHTSLPLGGRWLGVIVMVRGADAVRLCRWAAWGCRCSQLAPAGSSPRNNHREGDRAPCCSRMRRRSIGLQHKAQPGRCLCSSNESRELRGLRRRSRTKPGAAHRHSLTEGATVRGDVSHGIR